MTIQFKTPTAFEAKLRLEHRARQRRFAEAARRACQEGKYTETGSGVPAWKRSDVGFEAHVRAYQAHLANRKVRPEVIYLKRRAAELGLDYRDIVGRSAFRTVVEARRLLMWELRETFGLSFVEIGRAFGWRDPSTAISAVKTIENRRQETETGNHPASLLFGGSINKGDDDGRPERQGASRRFAGNRRQRAEPSGQ